MKWNEKLYTLITKYYKQVGIILFFLAKLAFFRHYSFCPWIAHAKLLAKYHRATVQEERQVTYTPKFGSEAFHL